jgi:hypothetical protein
LQFIAKYFQEPYFGRALLFSRYTGLYPEVIMNRIQIGQVHIHQTHAAKESSERWIVAWEKLVQSKIVQPWLIIKMRMV